MSIVLHPGMGDVVRQYEVQAARVMQRHGGQFLYVLKPTQAVTNADEIHLLVFESKQGFLDFRQDPELRQYRHLREAAVKHAEVVRHPLGNTLHHPKPVATRPAGTIRY